MNVAVAEVAVAEEMTEETDETGPIIGGGETMTEVTAAEEDVVEAGVVVAVEILMTVDEVVDVVAVAAEIKDADHRKEDRPAETMAAEAGESSPRHRARREHRGAILRPRPGAGEVEAVVSRRGTNAAIPHLEAEGLVLLRRIRLVRHHAAVIPLARQPGLQVVAAAAAGAEVVRLTIHSITNRRGAPPRHRVVKMAIGRNGAHQPQRAQIWAVEAERPGDRQHLSRPLPESLRVVGVPARRKRKTTLAVGVRRAIAPPPATDHPEVGVDWSPRTVHIPVDQLNTI